MKLLKLLFVIAALGVAPIGSAWADGGHGHHGHGHGWGGHGRIGIGIGIGPWAPWYYPPPVYYYPRTLVIEQPAPPVYIEQADQDTAPAAQANYWYYCSRSQAYYPYVKDCPAGWQRVVPQPPPQ